MFSSKIFALGLLFSCSFGLARVQINADLNLNEPELKSQKIIKIEIDLDVNRPFVYEESDIKIQATLLSEKENAAAIEWNIYYKNDAGSFELLRTSVLYPAYGKKAEIRLGEINDDVNIETFSISLIANKI